MSLVLAKDIKRYDNVGVTQVKNFRFNVSCFSEYSCSVQSTIFARGVLKRRGYFAWTVLGSHVTSCVPLSW